MQLLRGANGGFLQLKVQPSTYFLLSVPTGRLVRQYYDVRSQQTTIFVALASKTVLEYGYSAQSNEWYRNPNVHRLREDVQDILITDFYALVVCNSFSQVIYRSVVQQVAPAQKTSEPLQIIPGIVRFEFFAADDGQTYLIGITRSRVVFYGLQYSPADIVCYGSGRAVAPDVDHFHFQVQLLRRTCSEKSLRADQADYVFCQFWQNYYVRVDHPINKRLQA